jgi:hypothetical protein
LKKEDLILLDKEIKNHEQGKKIGEKCGINDKEIGSKGENGNDKNNK